MHLLTRRAFPVEFEWRRLAQLTSFIGGLAAVGELLLPTHGAGRFPDACARCCWRCRRSLYVDPLRPSAGARGQAAGTGSTRSPAGEPGLGQRRDAVRWRLRLLRAKRSALLGTLEAGGRADPRRQHRSPRRGASVITSSAATGERSPAHARNAGAAGASSDWILFLDADCRPAPELLDAYFAEPVDDDVGALAGEVVPAAGDAHARQPATGAARSFLSQEAHLAHPYPAPRGRGQPDGPPRGVRAARRLLRGSPRGRGHRLLVATAAGRLAARAPRRSAASSTATGPRSRAATPVARVRRGAGVAGPALRGVRPGAGAVARASRHARAAGARPRPTPTRRAARRLAIGRPTVASWRSTRCSRPTSWPASRSRTAPAANAADGPQVVFCRRALPGRRRSARRPRARRRGRSGRGGRAPRARRLGGARAANRLPRGRWRIATRAVALDRAGRPSPAALQRVDLVQPRSAASRRCARSRPPSAGCERDRGARHALGSRSVDRRGRHSASAAGSVALAIVSPRRRPVGVHAAVRPRAVRGTGACGRRGRARHQSRSPTARSLPPRGTRVDEFFYRRATGAPGSRLRLALKLAQHVPDMVRYRRLAERGRRRPLPVVLGAVARRAPTASAPARADGPRPPAARTAPRPGRRPASPV